MQSARTINVGIVGLGFMAATHIKAYRQIPEARIHTICSASGRCLDGDLTKVRAPLLAHSGNLGKNVLESLPSSSKLSRRVLRSSMRLSPPPSPSVASRRAKAKPSLATPQSSPAAERACDGSSAKPSLKVDRSVIVLVTPAKRRRDESSTPLLDMLTPRREECGPSRTGTTSISLRERPTREMARHSPAGCNLLYCFKCSSGQTTSS